MAKENGAHKLAIDCIYEALIQLMEKKEYKDITITDITNRAGVSRMAYYRNYTDKDEILLRRLRLYLDQAEADLKERQDLSREEFWQTFVRSEQEDPINETILQAGLFEQSFKIHKDYLCRIYSELFHLNMQDQNAILLIYQKLGSLFGCIIYMSEHKNDLDPAVVACYLARLAKDGV